MQAISKLELAMCRMLSKPQVLEVLRDRAERLEQRRRLRVFVDEHEVAELLAAHFVEAEARRVHAREVTLLAHRREPAGEVVGPAVVAAEEALGLALFLLDQRRATVPAGVVVGADAALFVAHDDDRRAGLAPQPVAAGTRQFVDVQRVQPRALPEVPLLQLEERGVGVAPARESVAVRGSRAADLRGPARASSRRTGCVRFRFAWCPISRACDSLGPCVNTASAAARVPRPPAARCRLNRRQQPHQQCLVLADQLAVVVAGARAAALARVRDWSAASCRSWSGTSP